VFLLILVGLQNLSYPVLLAVLEHQASLARPAYRLDLGSLLILDFQQFPLFLVHHLVQSHPGNLFHPLILYILVYHENRGLRIHLSVLWDPEGLGFLDDPFHPHFLCLQ